jgi:hypothetical protein
MEQVGDPDRPSALIRAAGEEIPPAHGDAAPQPRDIAASIESPAPPPGGRVPNETALRTEAPGEPRRSMPFVTVTAPSLGGAAPATMESGRVPSFPLVEHLAAEPSARTSLPDTASTVQLSETLPRPGGPPVAVGPWPAISPRPGDATLPPHEAPNPPIIRVTIGRVDVRAEFPAPSPARAPRRPATPTLSLQDYAKERSEGKR